MEADIGYRAFGVTGMDEKPEQSASRSVLTAEWLSSLSLS